MCEIGLQLASRLYCPSPLCVQGKHELLNGDLRRPRGGRAAGRAMELPLYDDGERHDDESGREVSAPTMVESLAWGSVAECFISLACPLVMSGPVDATATALNLVCPMLGGMAQALDDATDSASVHQRVAAFQAGFVGVATSFSFMSEQASLLAPWWRGVLYIMMTISGACVSFGVGRVALGAALRAKHLRRALVAGRALPSSARLQRILLFIVLVGWLWVFMTPPGAVFDPLAVRAAKKDAPLASEADDTPPPPQEPASKSADVAHLACGLMMQGLGLTISNRMGERVGTRARPSGGGARPKGGTIAYGPLLSNGVACTLLVVLRAAEAAEWLDDDGVFAAKVRTSFCGALSVSGMLGGFIVVRDDPHARAGRHDGMPLSPSREAVAGSSTLRGAVNLGTHAALAITAMLLLPRLQAWAAGAE